MVAFHNLVVQPRGSPFPGQGPDTPWFARQKILRALVIVAFACSVVAAVLLFVLPWLGWIAAAGFFAFGVVLSIANWKRFNHADREDRSGT
jgi:hypothetical protein